MREIKKIFSFGQLVLLFLSTILVVSLYGTWQSSVAKALRSGDKLFGVLVGTDEVDFSRHSDTIIVWVYDPRTGFIDLLSIPRDTKIELEGYKFNRINEVFAYHYSVKRDFHKASYEVLRALEELLNGYESEEKGSPHLQLSYYIHLDYQGFRRIIDALGGLTVQIDDHMEYKDQAGKLAISFEPGVHHLNGQRAMEYVRFRGRSGDRGRILRQQEFIRLLTKRVSNPFHAWRLPYAITTSIRSTHTNFTFWDILAWAWESRHISSSNILPAYLPGKPNRHKWEADPESVARVIRRLVGDSDSVLSRESSVLGSEDFRATTVKVWNASGKSRLAERVSRKLREAGFDVLDWGNYETRSHRTRVVDRTGDIHVARQVASVLERGAVLSEVNPRLFVDVEVILGEDYGWGR